MANGRVLGVNEDGNREWITLMATICADGTWGRPLLIYPSSAGALQDTWLTGVDPTQHNVAFSATASGWTNDVLGAQWLENFEVWSRDKLDNPQRDWRLLIVDGHGSHVTLRFFDICYQKRIILAVFPPHATHRLQPLDIGIFRPFAMKYSQHLDQWVNDRLGLCRFSKREFFSVFWPAFLQSFTEKNILSAWEKSGIWPRDPARVVNVVEYTTNSRPSTSQSATSTVSIHAYIRVRKRVRFALHGISDEMACMVADMFDKYQAALSIAEHERDCYKRAAVTEKSRRARSKPAADTAFIEKHGVRNVWDQEWMQLRQNHMAEIAAKATADELAKQEAKAQKQRDKEQKEVETAQRKAQKQALAQDTALQRRIAAAAAADAKAAEKAEKAAQKAADQQIAQEQKATQKKRNTKKQPPKASNKPQEVVVVDDTDNNGPPAPPRISSRGRTIRPPKHHDDA